MAIFAAGLAPTVVLRRRVFDGFWTDTFILLAQALDLAGSAMREIHPASVNRRD
jgi:hypothetical protein